MFSQFRGKQRKRDATQPHGPVQNAHRIRPHQYGRSDFPQRRRLFKDFRLKPNCLKASAAVRPPMPPPIIAIRISTVRAQFTFR
jgi:hypothetical protein